jgi:hypothetical protein
VCRFFGHKESELETYESDTTGKKSKTMLYGRVPLRDEPCLTKDHRNLYCVLMPRNHRRMVQHLEGCVKSWRANCDQTLILSITSDPGRPNPRDIQMAADYIS